MAKLFQGKEQFTPGGRFHTIISYSHLQQVALACMRSGHEGILSAESASDIAAAIQVFFQLLEKHNQNITNESDRIIINKRKDSEVKYVILRIDRIKHTAQKFKDFIYYQLLTLNKFDYEELIKNMTLSVGSLIATDGSVTAVLSLHTKQGNIQHSLTIYLKSRQAAHVTDATGIFAAFKEQGVLGFLVLESLIAIASSVNKFEQSPIQIS